MKINKEKVNQLRTKAQRSLNIIDLVVKGKTLPEIREKVPNADRNLIAWYIKALTEEEK